jgi:hypothetical protein
MILMLWAWVESDLRTVDRLLAAGFTNDDISVLLEDNKKDFPHEKKYEGPRRHHHGRCGWRSYRRDSGFARRNRNVGDSRTWSV